MRIKFDGIDIQAYVSTDGVRFLMSRNFEIMAAPTSCYSYVEKCCHLVLTHSACPLHVGLCRQHRSPVLNNQYLWNKTGKKQRFTFHRVPSFESQKPSFESQIPSFESQIPSFESQKPSFESQKPSFESQIPPSQHTDLGPARDPSCHVRGSRMGFPRGTRAILSAGPARGPCAGTRRVTRRLPAG